VSPRFLRHPAAVRELDRGPSPGPELTAERDRLTERFTLMQSELGGLFYEMAIRDHVQLDVLVGKAAELQRVDAELAQVERMLAAGEATLGGHCESCGSPYARGASFCAQCAHPLTSPTP
jgi:hypothetical protein